MLDLGDLHDRIDALAARAIDGDRSADLSKAMEDLLCDGYAACLQLDSRIRRLERRRRELVVAGLGDHRRGELRDIEDHRDSLERSAADARNRLGALRDRFVGLGAAQAAMPTDQSGDVSTSPWRIA